MSTSPMSKKKKIRMSQGKQRTHKSAVKRIKVTGGKEPKLLHRHKGRRHNISNKSKEQVRRLSRMAQFEGAFAKKLKQLLGIA
ncbi:MAG: 50S ribosomal protein L35 [Patescibacteria group bacterium]|nr:50S ribosomal protein L35 [Patescibacteria group bacterium]